MSPGSEGSQVPLRLWNAGQVTVLSLDDVCGEKQGEIFSQQVCGECRSRIFSLVLGASALSWFQKVRGSERLSGK